jgi:hypothetical protein
MDEMNRYAAPGGDREKSSGVVSQWRRGRNGHRIRLDRRRAFSIAIMAAVDGLGTKPKATFSSISTQLR